MMRDQLDRLHIWAFDKSFAIKMAYERISDRAKLIALSFFIIAWFSLCTVLFLNNYKYESDVVDKVAPVKIDLANDTLKKAELLSRVGSTSEAFNLLATHRNNFSKEYSESQMLLLESQLNDLTELAQEGVIADIYAQKDLVEVQPIYKFIGVISEINNDPMYGVTYTVSKDGERTQEQLEVTGLQDVSVGSQVEFFGVPTFDTVASPVKVEAYVITVEQEV